MRGTRMVEGAGVGALVVGPEAVGAREREVLNVPYLLASPASGDSPVDGAVASDVGSSRLEAVGTTSSSATPFCTGR